MVARDEGRGGSGSYFLMGAEFQFCRMKSILEVDGGGGCSTT